MASILALVLAYLLAAAPAHWWPFLPVVGEANSAPVSVPRGETPLPAPPVTTAGEDFADFVTGYYALMPDTAAGWPLIGPNLRQRGRASYDRFWGRYRGADVLDPPSVRAGQVTVRIALNPRDGGAAVVERHVLTVVRYDGSLRIDADEYLGRG